MTRGTGKTGLTCALELHVVLFGYLENVLALFGRYLFLWAVAFDEGEVDLGGEGVAGDVKEGFEGGEDFQHLL